MHRLRESLSSIGYISDADWEAFANVWEPISIGRKVNLTSPGQIENYTYFVLDGYQRVYHLDEQGRESTVIFTYEGDFGGVLDSFLLSMPSSYYYETLSKSELIRCNSSDFELVLASRPNLRKVIDKILYFAISGMMSRLVELQTYSSEQKFVNLIKRSPHVLQKIPHKYLANYIGIDPTNFSKLMNSVKVK